MFRVFPTSRDASSSLIWKAAVGGGGRQSWIAVEANSSNGPPVVGSRKSGTGAGNFANSSLYFMSRAASALFGAGDLDEVALYSGALSATTIANHFAAGMP